LIPGYSLNISNDETDLEKFHRTRIVRQQRAGFENENIYNFDEW